jgi:hypothetical protein
VASAWTAISTSSRRSASSSARAQGNRFPRARCGPVGRREVGVRHRELAARRKALEQIDRVPSPTLRLRGSAGAPDELREATERVPLSELVALYPAVLERFLERRDSFVVLIGQIARVGLALEQLGSLAQRQPVTEAERTCVLGGGLAMSAQRGSVRGEAGELVPESDAQRPRREHAR